MSYCECVEDGFCERYRRQMGGRMRELCAGVNVDLGTAAAFREQWSREVSFRANAGGKPMPLLLKTDQAPGDAVAMTAAIYSLHRAHPGRYLTAVESRWPEVFEHNPDVVAAESVPGASPLQMHYPAIHRSNERGIHFMQGWCEFIGSALGITVPLLTNRPRLYFNRTAPSAEDFWIICSGGKRDFTNKLWGHHNYQEVVHLLDGKVDFMQVGRDSDDHPRLRSVYDAVGDYSLRELFDLVRRSRGVVCGVSLLMHIAAALEKPAVVVVGGREPVAWNAYPKQHYLHTVGALPCTTPQGDSGACWRSRVVPLGDGTSLDRDTCLRPVDVVYAGVSVEALPECMSLIRPAEVAQIVMRYNRRYGALD